MSQDYSRMRYTPCTMLGLHNPGPQALTWLQWVTRTGLPSRQQDAKTSVNYTGFKTCKTWTRHQFHSNNGAQALRVIFKLKKIITIARLQMRHWWNACCNNMKVVANQIFLITPSLPMYWFCTTWVKRHSPKSKPKPKIKTKTKTNSKVKSQKSKVSKYANITLGT